MHHIVTLHRLCSFSIVGVCSPLVDVVPTMWSMTLMKRQCYLRMCQASKPPLSIPIQSHSLALGLPLFYCVRTTTIQRLLVVVVGPQSFPWPVFATVNSWNTLSWVGVVWAMMCLLIHACLSCLLLLRVVSGLIHQGWIGMWWTCPSVDSKVCEHDLVKVAVIGHVGVHGGLSHWSHP